MMKRYRCGVRHASDVVVCLDLLANRARFGELSALLVEAVDAAKPTPQVLWRWAAEYVEFLDPWASKRLVDAQLEGRCRHPGGDAAEAAAKSGDYMLALLASGVEVMCTGSSGSGAAWHALARPVVTAALRHKRRGFHYDDMTLDVLSTLAAVVDRDPLPAWLARLREVATTTGGGVGDFLQHLRVIDWLLALFPALQIQSKPE